MAAPGRIPTLWVRDQMMFTCPWVFFGLKTCFGQKISCVLVFPSISDSRLIANTKLSTWTQTTPFCLSIFASASRIQEEMLLWWPEIHGLPLSCRHADDGRQHPISSTPRRGAFALCKPLDPALLRGVCVVRRPTVGACAFFGAFSSPSFVV